MNEKCINVTNMKPKEDFVAFGNAKDFNQMNQMKSSTLLCCLQSFYFIYINGKWKLNARFFMYFKNN